MDHRVWLWGLATTATAEQGCLCTGQESDYLLIALLLSFLLPNGSLLPVGPLCCSLQQPRALFRRTILKMGSSLSSSFRNEWFPSANVGGFYQLRQKGKKRQSYLDHFCSLNISSSSFLQFHGRIFSTFIKDKLTKTQSVNSQTV